MLPSGTSPGVRGHGPSTRELLLFLLLWLQVVVGGEGSEVNVWDIDTGEMVVQFGDCHGSNEITAMAIDASGRRLITGSRKGDIKVCVSNFHSNQTD